MNCKQAEQILLTDYPDGELSGAARVAIQDHLQVCAHCRTFEQRVRVGALLPFKAPGDLQPPEGLWQDIAQSIQAAPARPFWAEKYIWGPLRFILVHPRPAFAAATFVVVVSLTLAMMRVTYVSRARMRTYVAEQMFFLSNVPIGSGPFEEGIY
jgi:anti-sigma factor RsiW